MEISREDEEITKRHLTYLQLKLENLKEPLKKKLAGNIKITARVSMLMKGVNRKFKIRSGHWKTTGET